MTARERETSAPWWRSWRTARWGDWIGLGARLILGGVLFIAGALKITNLEYNVLAVKAYQLVSPEAAQIIGYLQPPLEMLLGLALILGLFTRVMGALGALLMVVFIFGIASAAARGINIDCGCFSKGGEVAAGETTYAWDIIRDIGLLLLGVWLAIRPRSAWSLDGWLQRSGHDDLEMDDWDDDEAGEPTKASSKSRNSDSGSKAGAKKRAASKAAGPAAKAKSSPTGKASRSGKTRPTTSASKSRAATGTASRRATANTPVKAKVGSQKRSGSSRSRKR